MNKKDSTVRISSTTQELVAEFDRLYARGMVFEEDGPALLRNSELDSLLPRLFLGLARDLRNHLGQSGDFQYDGQVFHNRKAIARSCGCSRGRNICDYVLYDFDEGTCTYIGSRQEGLCA